MQVTPLFMASLNANERLVRAFLRRGADPTVPVPDGNTSFKLIERTLSDSPETAERYEPTLSALCEAAAARCAQRRDALAAETARICLRARADGGILPRKLDAFGPGLPGILPTWAAFLSRADEPPSEVFLSLASAEVAERDSQGMAGQPGAGEPGPAGAPPLPRLYRRLVEAGGASRACGEALLRRRREWDMLSLALRMLDALLDQFPAVRVIGLAARPEFNGQLGEVAGPRTEHEEGSPDAPYIDRYPVRLVATGRVIKCRPQNLQLRRTGATTEHGGGGVQSSIEEQD
jgi:hypothetical protein